MNDLTSDKTLSNPKFEGYKLQIIEQDETITRYSLSHLPSQSTMMGQSLLTFKEVQSRVSYNHLCVPPIANSFRALYVDADWHLVLSELDKATNSPQFRVIYDIPKPPSNHQKQLGPSDVHPEYPSAAFLDDDICFVSDGYGFLYVLSIDEQTNASLLGIYQLPNSRPFHIHTVQKVSETESISVLSYPRERDKGAQSDSQLYEVCAARFRIPFTATESLIILEIIWRRRGSDPPIDVLYDRTRRAHILLGGSQYTLVDQGVTVLPHDTRPEEIVPIPGAVENLDDDSKPSDFPPPFSWTQTSDSLTAAFPLPSSTPKNAIKIALTQRGLTIRIMSHSGMIDPLSLPSYDSKPFWSEISVESSLWTWDRDAHYSHGLLTLHLEKLHDSVRWPHFFEPSQSYPEDDVPETLDPSEIYNIRESLEKYTTTLKNGEDAPELNLGHGVPSLAQGELDDEADSNVGKHAFQTWVPWESESNISSSSTQFTLLSSPLPGIDSLSLVVKNQLDGNLFSVNHVPDTSAIRRWCHTAMFPALAFVLASKRDSRFTYHTDNTVLLFESGIREGTGNVFIYRKTEKLKDAWAKQSVLKITTGGNALLGVGLVNTRTDGNILVCLTERELVLVRQVV